MLIATTDGPHISSVAVGLINGDGLAISKVQGPCGTWVSAGSSRPELVPYTNERVAISPATGPGSVRQSQPTATKMY